MSTFPEGDPAQHLVEEVLFRAAKKAGMILINRWYNHYPSSVFKSYAMNSGIAGMDFHELLDIPQGDRRKYHDDVSIIIISFEGRIWRSSMQLELE